MARPFSLFGRSSSLLLLIFYKLLMAISEILAGILFLLGAFFSRHVSLVDTIAKLSDADKDTLDQFIHWLVRYLTSLNIDYQLILHIGLVLIGLGIFKIFVAIGLWFKSHKMRLIAIAIFGALSAYSIYELTLNFSVIKLIALMLDLAILYYFWRVLPKHLAD